MDFRKVTPDTINCMYVFALLTSYAQLWGLMADDEGRPISKL
jgi:hypothetical protein